MAAPVVSGIAALLRTKFADKSLYSSRFIMGQLAVGRGGVIDASRSLTDTPRPDVSYLSHVLFDTTAQDAGNDGDGRVDSGETVDVAITIRNQRGRADNVTVTLDAFAEGAIGPDPYVTMITGSVDYGAIGSFNEDDNGIDYGSDGNPSGVANPFRFVVDPRTPNGHLIPFRLTVNSRNGLDANDNNIYTTTSRFYVSVQRGRSLPSRITESMVLDPTTFWLIDKPVIIEEGVQLDILPGTEVQWFGTENAYPYLMVDGVLEAHGTQSDPVFLSIQPSLINTSIGTRSGRFVDIRNRGTVNISYATIQHPWIGASHFNAPWGVPGTKPANTVDHVTSEANGGLVSIVSSQTISNSYFGKGISVLAITGDRNWADSWPGTTQTSNSVLARSYQLTYGGQPQLGPANAALWDGSAISSSGIGRDEDLRNVFWGVENEEIVGARVVDRDSNWELGYDVVVLPTAESASVETFPFVTKVAVAREGGEPQSLHWSQQPFEAGVGAYEFFVTFNREMDTSVSPIVAFGPAEPFTDWLLTGDWVDAQTWKARMALSPLTGDGFQYLSISKARAASDPWLVTGNDSKRFRFEIITSGTEAMNLQASGGEGKVDLSWTQDDFDLLAGYNIYRATAIDGSYTRVNSTIIPKEVTAFTDTSVQPARNYFYKFRIVKTDSTESVDSNVAAAAPLDTIPPVISHTPVASSAPAVGLTIRAEVTDNLGVTGVVLHYRRQGESSFSSQAMTLTTGNRYTATIGASAVGAPGVEYYLTASDGVTTVYSGLAAQPYLVRVVDAPLVTSIMPSTGPAAGGTNVTIVGTNFKTGASVTIGGAA